jgi:hypothetical protein
MLHTLSPVQLMDVLRVATGRSHDSLPRIPQPGTVDIVDRHHRASFPSTHPLIHSSTHPLIMITVDLLADPPASCSSIGGTPRPDTESTQNATDTTALHHWQGVLESAMDAVGHTPLIKLNRFAESQGVKCNIR